MSSLASTTTAREQIKDALAESRYWPDLDGWPGVHPYTAEPDQKVQGAAWPVLRELNPEGTLGHANVKAYDVYLVLGAAYSPRTAQLAEELIEPLVETLRRIGEWTPPAALEQVVFDVTTVLPALRVRITPAT